MLQTLGAGVAAGALWPTGAVAQSGNSRNLPSAPVAVARCTAYDDNLSAILRTMADQIGGLGPIVKGKTVTIKLNLTGSPALRCQGRPLGNERSFETVLMAANRDLHRAALELLNG